MFVSRTWRWKKLILGMLVFEFPFTVAGLALFGIASPNLYRTQLWQEGGDLGFNSSPNTILYAYANYKPVKIPLVWSSLYAPFPQMGPSFFMVLTATTAKPSSTS